MSRRVAPWCEPTTHRFVRRAFHPTPHHPLECRPEPTPSTPARGGSGLHCRSGASRASSTGGRWSGSAACVLPPICEVSRVVTGTDAGNGGTGANDARVSRTAIASATNRSDALSVRGDKNEAMRCRKKRSDALSVRTLARLVCGCPLGTLDREGPRPSLCLGWAISAAVAHARIGLLSGVFLDPLLGFPG